MRPLPRLLNARRFDSYWGHSLRVQNNAYSLPCLHARVALHVACDWDRDVANGVAIGLYFLNLQSRKIYDPSLCNVDSTLLGFSID